MLHEELTQKIIGAFYNVYNSLGYGFLEKVYEKSLIIELLELGLYCEAQKPVEVYYKNQQVGEYFADIIVEDKIILELKSGEGIITEHTAQLLNYLKATEIEVGLILNFGRKPSFKRMIYENEYKNNRGD